MTIHRQRFLWSLKKTINPMLLEAVSFFFEKRRHRLRKAASSAWLPSHLQIHFHPSNSADLHLHLSTLRIKAIPKLQQTLTVRLPAQSSNVQPDCAIERYQDLRRLENRLSATARKAQGFWLETPHSVATSLSTSIISDTIALLVRFSSFISHNECICLWRTFQSGRANAY